MKRLLVISIFLLIVLSPVWAQKKLNILYPLTDFPGANIMNLVPALNNTFVVSSIYRENNSLSSSAYFTFDSSYIKTTKEVGFSNSIDGLRFSNNKFVSFGKNRSDATLLQIRTYNNELDLIKIDSVFDDSDSTFPTNSQFGLNRSYFTYFSEYYASEINLATLLIKDDKEDIRKIIFGEEYEDSYITDIELSKDGNILLSLSFRFIDIIGAFGQVIKIDTLGNEIWKYEGNDRFDNGAILPFIVELSNNNIVQLYNSKGDQALHTTMIWLDSNGTFLKNKVIDVPGLDELYYYEVVPGRGDYFFAHGQYIFGDNESYHGILSKFDNDGNLIWNRFYQHSKFLNKDEFHSIEDIHELHDGRIIMLATARDFFGPSNIWLFEVDANGCYNEGCDSFQLITNTNDLAQKKLDEVILYPNPTHHLVHLPSHFKGTLSIFDLNGRSVLTTTVKEPSDQIVDVQHIEPGLYVCRMIFDNGRILDKKLLIR